MRYSHAFQGWVFLVGVPTLFCVAYLVGGYPMLLGLPLCGVKLFVGIPCPGCGLTHAFAALTHGHLRESIAWHPLGIIIAACLLYQFGRSIVETLVRRPLPHLLSDGTRFFVLNVFLAALLLQWFISLAMHRW